MRTFLSLFSYLTVVSILLPGASLAAQESASDQFQKAIIESNGKLTIPAGRYEFDKTIEIDLTKLGSVVIRADGPVTIVMKGPGPAFRLVGSHLGSANPAQVKPATWNERMPLIEGFEILGDHEEASGIELIKTIQATILNVAIRNAHHGIRLAERNRNVLISDCHIYGNRGAGVFLDNVNLHQINITGCHISYNEAGGVVVRDGEVRNLHITGCDIESNMPNDASGSGIANILLDQSSETKSSIAEVAITGCTIQHTGQYGRKQPGVGGVNIRILGNDSHRANMITITGNILSEVTTNIQLDKVIDVTVTGNTFFTTRRTDMIVENSSRVVVSGNAFNPRDAATVGQLIFRNCSHCLLTNSTLHDLKAKEGAIVLEKCQFFRLNNLILSKPANGIQVRDCNHCTITDLTVTGLPEGTPAVVVDDASKEITVRDVISVP